jgi:hypothetical protein
VTSQRASAIFGQALKQHAQEAFQTAKAQAAERIANTAGGRIAQRIRLSHSEPPAAGEVSEFRDGGGSIGAPASEAAAQGGEWASASGGGATDGASASLHANDLAFGSDASGPGAETRGHHQPTGVREDADGAE